MFLSKATIIVSVAIFGGSVQVKAQCPSNDNGQCKYISYNVCGYHIEERILSNLYISYIDIDDISQPLISRFLHLLPHVQAIMNLSIHIPAGKILVPMKIDV